MTRYNRIVLASRPKGPPGLENFRLETADLPAPGHGEVLVRTIWLSLDPYMRGRMDAGASYADPVEVGHTMTAGCVAEVLASNFDGLAPGDAVVGGVGWASHGILPGKAVVKVDPDLAPVSTALGVLGMPGHTAWVGLNDILQIRSGETIVVSAATGAVGSLAGQLAKRAGLRVIGVAGGAEKCRYAVDALGYDVCLDHRDPDLAAEMAAVTPQGVDCYYENVGGKTLEAVLPRMNDFGRIAVCGMIAWYSGKGVADAMRLPAAWRAILVMRLRVQGFIVFDHLDRLAPFLAEVGPLVASGQIHYRETVTEGLENAPAAFLRLLEGGNFGKQLVRVGADP
ncbi:MAG: NADP-dependent oxidoreductase [Rhodobacter sp.]|nr:NADP-dependent oxidoreductase [Rhodobacter sp.]